MRVLQVVTDRDRRGAQVFALDLESGLAALGLEATTVALAPGRFGDALPIDALGPSRRNPRTLPALRSIATGHDVVVAHGSSTLFACATSLVGGPPFIYRQISDPQFWAATPSRRVRAALLLRMASAIVALSPGVAATFASHYRLPLSALTVIPNAVPGADFGPADPEQRRDGRRHLGVPAEAFVVVSLGALVPEKGVDAAVRAVAPLPNAHLVVAGDGPEHPALEALGARIAPGRVHLVGSVDRAADILHAADVLVLPSRGGDSMPAVLIEAGLCGLPTVTTTVGAVPEVVIDGTTGRTVAPGDERGFTQALSELALDEPLRRRMGDAALGHCQSRFTIDAIAPSWRDLLATVVDESGHGWHGAPHGDL